VDKVLLGIQTKLKGEGFDVGPLDGVWGNRTRDAIARKLGVAAIRPATPAAGQVEAPWFDLAMTQIGVKETAGDASNPAVLKYYTDAQASWAKEDSIPWCAAFVGAMLAETGYKPSGSLIARSYLDWGTALDKPRKGCIVVMKRGAPPAGHVAFAEDWSAGNITLLGGNQGDAVSVKTFSRANVIGYRWPRDVL
jgi:uncharacterized protein (TIGR02594 family)